MNRLPLDDAHIARVVTTYADDIGMIFRESRRPLVCIQWDPSFHPVPWKLSNGGVGFGRSLFFSEKQGDFRRFQGHQMISGTKSLQFTEISWCSSLAAKFSWPSPTGEGPRLYTRSGASSVHAAKGLVCTRGMGLLYVPVCSYSCVFRVLHVCRLSCTGL